MGGIEIRAAQPSDRMTIRDLVYAAFQNHPHHAPGALPSEHLIVERLEADGALTLSLVAVSRGDVVGHLAVSPVTVAGQACNWFGIGPVAVTPRQQRHGIGSRLVRQAIELLRVRKASGLTVLGEPAYYQRFGFRVAPGLILPGIPPEYFMALAFDGRVTSGVVAYHPAFS